VAKPKKIERKDPNEALKSLERPEVRWKIVLQVALGFAVVWALAIGLMPWTGYWGIGAAAVLTLVALGFAFYLWRLTRKSQAIVDILKTATDREGRKAALEELEKKGKGGDAMAALAQAQLVAQESPAEAMKILEALDMKKVPALMQNDVRANLALLYLMNNRTRDARALADEIKLDAQAQAKQRAMYAAVVAESQARTGKPEEAKTLLEAYDPSDPTLGEISAMLLRAQVYAFMGVKKRGLAKQSMQKLAEVEPNLVAQFAMKGGNPELAKMAREIIQGLGIVPKQKVRMRMR
jgi:hypothetical protein